MAFRESLCSGSPYWLICDGVRRGGAWGFEAFSVEFEGEKVLIVFTDEGRAEMFAWLAMIEGSPGTVSSDSGGRFRTRDMRPKPCSGGELVSLLAVGGSGGGPCANVRKVSLDPPPEILFAEALSGLDVNIPRVGCDVFVESLIGRDGTRCDAEREAEWEKG